MYDVKSSFTELVRALEDPSETSNINCALRNLYSALRTGGENGHLSPEFLVKLSRIRLANSTTRLFEEHGLMPGIAAMICRAVQRRIGCGGAISLQTLNELKTFITSPHRLGAEGSVRAYEALVTGLTSFYQDTASFEKRGFPTNPADIFAGLTMALHRNAPNQPRAIADIVRKLGSIQVDPRLLDSLDVLLVNTAHPARAIPAEVREAAIYALTDRIKRPPLRYQTAEAPGCIDSLTVFTLFKDICERCDQEIAIEAAVKSIPAILRPAADSMLQSPDALAFSPFVERGLCHPSDELRRMIRAIKNSPINGQISTLNAPLAEAFEQAARLSNGIATHRASNFLASLAPPLLKEKIRDSLHKVFRGVDRLFH